jgi:hypothetical protein
MVACTNRRGSRPPQASACTCSKRHFSSCLLWATRKLGRRRRNGHACSGARLLGWNDHRGCWRDSGGRWRVRCRRQRNRRSAKPRNDGRPRQRRGLRWRAYNERGRVDRLSKLYVCRDHERLRCYSCHGRLPGQWCWRLRRLGRTESQRSRGGPTASSCIGSRCAAR